MTQTDLESYPTGLYSLYYFSRDVLGMARPTINGPHHFTSEAAAYEKLFDFYFTRLVELYREDFEDQVTAECETLSQAWNDPDKLAQAASQLSIEQKRDLIDRVQALENESHMESAWAIEPVMLPYSSDAPTMWIDVANGELIGVTSNVPGHRLEVIDHDVEDGPDTVDGSPCAIRSHVATYHPERDHAPTHASENAPYYKTTFVVTTLSMGPLPDGISLDDIAHEMDQGDIVGTFYTAHEESLDGQAIAQALYSAGSEPSFFGLDASGQEID